MGLDDGGGGGGLAIVAKKLEMEELIVEAEIDRANRRKDVIPQRNLRHIIPGVIRFTNTMLVYRACDRI